MSPITPKLIDHIPIMDKRGLINLGYKLLDLDITRNSRNCHKTWVVRDTEEAYY